MALWAAKGIGVLFGGVYDDDRDEETLESVFYNDMWVWHLFQDLSSPQLGGLNEISRYGYQLAGNGRWISLALKRPKKKISGGARKAKKVIQQVEAADTAMDEDDRLEEEDGPEADTTMVVNYARQNILVSHLIASP